MDNSLRTAWGIGLATLTASDTVLDVWFPQPALGPLPQLGDANFAGPTGTETRGAGTREATGHDAGASSQLSVTELTETLAPLVGNRPEREVRQEIVTVEINLDTPVTDTVDAYLRLHLLSHLLVTPNSISLDGLIPALPNNIWTTAGPVEPATFDRLRPVLRAQGIVALGLDKFPRLLDYVTPEKVRIADGDRVRLGAHLAPGTTVMHEGFVNFNAGTLGSSMVEGRISQGVVISDGADIGGGASIMGTLSGGGKERITVGARALLGANSGVGISIGEDAVVEAGLYVTAGTKVTLIEGESQRTVKAKDLSGVPNLLFRRNSTTGGVEALPRSGAGVVLNTQLHA